MFVDIEKFEQEKETYDNQIKELENSSEAINVIEAKKTEINNAFRAQLRKYLTLALGVIYDILEIKYSLYHQGTSFDSNFKKVDTNVSKSIAEIKEELDNIRKISEEKNLDDTKKHKIDIAIKIVLTYAIDRDSQVESKVVEKSEAKKVEEPIVVNNTENSKPNDNNDKSKPIALIIIGIIATIVAILAIIGII